MVRSSFRARAHLSVFITSLLVCLSNAQSLIPASDLPGNWTYTGCYNDTAGSRTLSGAKYDDGQNMNGTACVAYCQSKNYVYAGTEYSADKSPVIDVSVMIVGLISIKQCYCGNVLGDLSSLQPDSSCGMSCSGDSTEVCGGPDLLTIYYANQPAPQGPFTNPGPGDWTSFGCWTDGQPRTLRYGMQVPGGPSNMTVNGCTSTCAAAGYALAGVEYAGECYCDDYVDPTATNTTLSDCNMPCNGNSTEFCGAGNRLDVYAFGLTVPSVQPEQSSSASSAATPIATAGPSVAVVSGWGSLGCYNDSVGSRTLQYGQGGLGDMTVEKCTSACMSGGYSLAGVEYGRECYCDNEVENAGGPALDGDVGCNMPCTGDSSELCGGPSRLNVFSLNATATSTSASQDSNSASGIPSETPLGPTTTQDGPPGYTTSPTPSSIVDESAIFPFTYLGCYTDNAANGRTLSYQQFDNGNLTVESCIASCSSKGYTIAGLEYSYQCFCDTYVHNSPTAVSDLECNMACAGDSQQNCGAGNRLSVYANGTLVDAITPVVQNASLPGKWVYQGCLTDAPAFGRSLPYQIDFLTNNSNTACLSLCQAYGYGAGGTEFGLQCFCGDVADVAAAGATIVPDSQCNMVCTDDLGKNGGHYCGGPDRISYYTWSGRPLNSWTVADGNDAGAYEFLIGGVVIPLVTQPARNGKVTYLEKFGTSIAGNSSGAYELDLSQLNNFTAAWRPMSVKSDVFCSASLTLPDRVGRQINIGGWSYEATYGVRLYWPDGSPGVAGENDWQENFNEVRLLNGRWYPTAMKMANGSILVMGGEAGSNGAPIPTLEVLPSPSGEVIYCDYLDRTDPYNLYPYLAVLPSGDIFVAYYNEARILDATTLQTKRTLPNIPGAVNNPAGGRTYPLEGTAMVLPQYAPYTAPLTVMICGGSTPYAGIALDNCVSIKPDQANSTWVLERMPSKRVIACMTALPDGTFLILNGATQGQAGFGLAVDPNLNAVLYDPAKRIGARMTIMANTTVARLYHSEAVLLDDGRVLVSGSDPEDARYPQEYRNEVFIPPYLMSRARRPVMNLTTLDWAYGQQVSFDIVSLGSGLVSQYRVSLMGSVGSTHGNSMGQRTYFPTTSCSGSTCTVTAPPNANICPPSWFQVFLLDANNVPSNATWVRIGGDPANLGDWPNFSDFDTPGMGPVTPLY